MPGMESTGFGTRVGISCMAVVSRLLNPRGNDDRKDIRELQQFRKVLHNGIKALSHMSSLPTPGPHITVLIPLLPTTLSKALSASSNEKTSVTNPSRSTRPEATQAIASL